MIEPIEITRPMIEAAVFELRDLLEHGRERDQGILEGIAIEVLRAGLAARDDGCGHELRRPIVVANGG